jgi:hypothetical protein
MQFNDNASTKLGLVNDVWFLTNSTSESYPLVDVTRNLNRAYEDTVALIWQLADDWQYDSSNVNDLPILYRTVANASASYNIPSTAQQIHRVEIKDNNSDWHRLTLLDYRDVSVAMPEFRTDTGLPVYYDLVGSQIVLYPPPGTGYVTMSSGMAVYVSRDVSLFTTASTTATPGFAPQFHRVLSLSAALDFEKDPQQRQYLLLSKQKVEESMKRFYSSRATERRISIKPANKKNWRQYL